MKNLRKIGLLTSAVLVFASCSKNDEPATERPVTKPTASQFAEVRNQATKALTQSFVGNGSTGRASFKSIKGVNIKMNTDNLRKNGEAVTGPFEIQFIEIFDKGHMLSANKSTMGRMLDFVNQSIMKSGGEFYLNATQGGVQLTTVGITSFTLEVPANITGTLDTGMTFWEGTTADPENIVWDRKGPLGFEQIAGGTYIGTFGNFGWSNIDRLIALTGPKTQILASVPQGFNETNCAIYFSIDGEGQNQLAKFDIYNSATMQFSEHYGQVPIGMACHIIFASAEGSQWRYAVKGITVTAGGVTNFTLAETVVGTEAQMVTAINAIQ